MQILILYDSLYGNTEKIAGAIGAGCGPYAAQLVSAAAATPEQVRQADLLIVGSPTHGGRPSPRMKQFLSGLEPDLLRGKTAAAFDTGIPAAGKPAFLRFMMKFLGYASRHIARALEGKGAKVVGAQTFFVLDKEGPLKPGELERAQQWVSAWLQRIELPALTT